MAGRGSHAPSVASQPAAAGNSGSDYINGHGNLPEAPAPAPAPPTQSGKKGKNKKAPDANEVGKALAAKINQLELDAAGEKDQEVEIGGFPSSLGTRESILGCMKELDLPQDMIARAMRLLSAENGSKTTFQGGPPTPEKMEPLLADLAGVSDLLSALPNFFTAAQQKLTTLPPGLVATLEREVKKATRDLTNLLNQMDNPMAKLETLQKKYSELLSDMRRMDRENAKNKKRADLYQKEKDQGRSQLTKTDAVRAKLESVCRELQRENKKLKDEQKRIESDEKSSREELSDRADQLLWELEESMARTDAPQSQAQDLAMDEMFQQRFKSFIEQYEFREIHFFSILKMKDCEMHAASGRAEQERKRAENEALKSHNLNSQVQTFNRTESELRSQLNIYVEKFKQVEDTLNNSNDLFLTFRKEMEEMSKKSKRLEKDNHNLTRKHDLTNRNILEMAEERTKSNKEMETLRRRNAVLEKLARGIQTQNRSTPGLDAALDVPGDEDEETQSDEDYGDEEDDDEYAESEEGEEYDHDQDLGGDGQSAEYEPLDTGPAPRVNGVQRHVNGEVNGVTSSVG